MSPHFTEICLPAYDDKMPELSHWLLTAVAAAEIAEGHGARLQLILEELFANTIEHGFAGNSEQPVAVALTTRPTGVTLRYCDRAPPFDPTAARPLEPDDERIGGFGLNLIRAMSSAIRYRRDAGWNITELDFDFSAYP